MWGVSGDSSHVGQVSPGAPVQQGSSTTQLHSRFSPECRQYFLELPAAPQQLLVNDSPSKATGEQAISESKLPAQIGNFTD